MKTLRLKVELTYDDEMMHSGDGDKAAKDWFFGEVLCGELELFNKIEIGDEIGKVKVISILNKDEL